MLFGGRLIAAIKPWVFEHLLKAGANSAIYIDSDIMIFDSLKAMADAAERHGVVVVPHVLTPMPRDGRLPSETLVLGVGAYNGGCFAVGAVGVAFLEFMKERLCRECRTDVPGMRVNEQRWLDFVPALFDHHVLRDPGVDAAPWNIHERRLTLVEGQLYAGEEPLRAFHFSGFDPRMPTVLSARDFWERPRVQVRDEPLLSELCDRYAHALNGAGFGRQHCIPFAYDFLADGTPVYASLRRLYTDALLHAEATGGSGPPDPFEAVDADAFRSWAQAAYAKAGEEVPERLARKGMGPTTAEDWIGRMAEGEAGVRNPIGAVCIDPSRRGVVLVGPGALADAGHYRAIVELWLGDRSAVEIVDSTVLLIEALVDGFVLSYVSVDRRGSSSVALDFVIPTELQDVALSAGVEMSVQCFGGASGTIRAVLVERVGDVATTEYVVPSDWLPAMWVGDVGERTESQVVRSSGRAGFMVEGPLWRLDGGRYRAELGLHPLVNAHGGRPSGGTTVVALAEVVIHGYVMAFRAVTGDDLAAGRAALEFELAGRWADDRYTRVELRVRAQAELDAVLDSVRVQRIGDVNPVAVVGETDWLPALWIDDNAVRVGTEVHSFDGKVGVLAHGPGWRLNPGWYRFDVVIEGAEGEISDTDPTGVARVQVLCDGAEVGERLVTLRAADRERGVESTYSIEFEVLARAAPPPLLELTPVVDLRISTEGSERIFVRSAILSRKEESV